MYLPLAPGLHDELARERRRDVARRFREHGRRERARQLARPPPEAQPLRVEAERPNAGAPRPDAAAAARGGSG